MKILVLLFGFITGLFQAIKTQWGNWLALRHERGVGFKLWLLFIGVPQTVLKFAGLASLAIFLCFGAILYGIFSTGRALTPRLSR